MKPEAKKTEIIAEAMTEATTKTVSMVKPATTPNIPGMPDRKTIAHMAARSYIRRAEFRRKLAACKSIAEKRRAVREIHFLAIKLYT